MMYKIIIFNKNLYELQKNLISGKDKIAVWGTGYIGLSTMAFFKKKNILRRFRC